MGMTAQKAERMISLGNSYRPSDEFTNIVVDKFVEYRGDEYITEAEMTAHLETVWIAWNAFKVLIDRDKAKNEAQRTTN